ncbi:RNA dependent RNA polymerase [Plasmopara viticola lesion associated ourmia-like virus 48]|uniref:RNA dependent RNA polymerase n=1 Tax=Plasmopara viticola lesion associated ourmia-like virus 48 TaxID=2686518 RepID=A0ABX6FQ76_9VIRU|nr:RNA dependent RNA polymerase [Plasmopara viticola lesion associated ourmia-like virus 48]QGY72578.1 RNA dependent RNA polymerase [Plasmopara viticola lesion associated ourmia-like virus 48]
MVSKLLCADGQQSAGLREPHKGGRSQPCSCRLIERRTKEVIENGLKIIRVRFSIPAGELPYLETSRLSIYLLSLLSPSPSRLVRMPRSGLGFDSDGFPILTRLGRMERWRLASSVASIKRALPSDTCQAHPPPSRLESWTERQCSEQAREAPEEYRLFARRIASEVFKSGWDRTYRSFCKSFVPKFRARAERIGDSRFFFKADRWWSSHSSRREYLDTTIRGSRFDYDHPSRYCEVPTAGKVRPMIIPSVSIDLLGPLHKTLYQCLVSQPWLLRGSPTVDRLSSILEQEWKTSVDLVNATDGLTLDICDIALDVCQSNSSSVPSEIFERARRSLRPHFTAQGNDYRVSNGQMMGQYLSFPLLCFQSYVAARWATRGLDAKIAVNGDDCLIGCSSNDIINRYPSHLSINFDKTAVRTNVAEINSTQFIRWGRKWKEVRTARRLGGLNSLHSGLLHMAMSCLSAGDKWVTAFVRTRIGRRSRVSPVHLGLPITNREVFLRHRGMPCYRILPDMKVDNDDRLEKVEEKPSDADVDELRTLLFDEGRFVPIRDVPDKIKDLPYRPSNVSTLYVRDRFARIRRIVRAEKREKKEIYFRVKRDPVPMKEPEVRYENDEQREYRLAYESLVSQEFQARSEIDPIKIKECEVIHLRGRST